MQYIQKRKRNHKEKGVFFQEKLFCPDKGPLPPSKEIKTHNTVIFQSGRKQSIWWLKPRYKRWTRSCCSSWRVAGPNGREHSCGLGMLDPVRRRMRVPVGMRGDQRACLMLSRSFHTIPAGRSNHLRQQPIIFRVSLSALSISTRRNFRI